ncbi:winged helix DNA-binding domain family [Trichomonas vaginalis G3]|uniref:winged helix DNA-binding domain family n=1 Tax=Trichomonas vaginalis (strain ATCC PRA-98 / G3) TaxID=412133 RepID=UPI0021E5C980|nr:winged helix DNA-binding domain family [Trichomonas vaginalis G3]KAI5515529.1 winged helix DNA-binding domain family [Trichomonas vaginalis G3]
MTLFRKLFSFLGCNDTQSQLRQIQEKPTIKLLSNSSQDRLEIIRDQVEYYLSASSLRDNKNLRTFIKKSIDRFVPLDTFLEYNKMKNLCVTFNEIHDACVISNDLELNTEGNAVRTKLPVNINEQEQIAKMVRLTDVPLDTDLERLRQYIVNYFGNIEKFSANHTIQDSQRMFSGIVTISFTYENNARVFPNKFLYEDHVIQSEPFEEYQLRMKRNRAQKRQPK